MPLIIIYTPQKDSEVDINNQPLAVDDVHAAMISETSVLIGSIEDAIEGKVSSDDYTNPLYGIFLRQLGERKRCLIKVRDSYESLIMTELTIAEHIDNGTLPLISDKYRFYISTPDYDAAPTLLHIKFALLKVYVDEFEKLVKLIKLSGDILDSLGVSGRDVRVISNTSLVMKTYKSLKQQIQ